MRRVMKRGLPLLILALGAISLVFGVLFVMGSEQMKAGTVEGFSRSEGVNTAADIEALKNTYSSQKQTMEDKVATELGFAGPFGADNKLPREVTQQLYTSNPAYPAMIDAQLAYGLGTLLLGTATIMLYSGIAMLTIGIALVLIAVVPLRAFEGMFRIGASLHAVRTKLAHSVGSELPELPELPERA